MRKWKAVIQIIALATIIAILGACGETDEVTNDHVSVTEEQNNDGSSEETKIDEPEQEEKDAVGVTPSNETYREEIEFQRVNWIGGAPKIHDQAGLWLYTKENHPGAITSHFDWEEEDVLEWQISNEEYFKYKVQTRALEVLDSNVVKIVVEIGDEELVESRKKTRNQDFLIVERGKLEGMNFIIETTDGIELSLQD